MEKRRIVFIYPQFQLALLVAQLTSLILFSLLILYQSHQFISNLRDMGFQAGFPEGHGYFQFLKFQETYLLKHLVYSIGIALIASICLTLYFSHRLAGPIVRLRLHLQELNLGRKALSDKLQFRKGDYFSELPTEVNALIEKFYKSDVP